MATGVLAGVLVVVVGAALSACGSDEEGCAADRLSCEGNCVLPPVASLDYIQNEIFARQCDIQLCHGAVATQEELLLNSATTSCEELIGVESIQQDGAILIVPGSPAQSYLMNKLTGLGMAARSSENEPTEQMPNGPARLCQEQIDIVRDWIAADAPGCP